MAFLQIKSTNPDLSFILKKNPSAGLVARKMRKGVTFGYYSDNAQTYNVFFKDAFNEISYPEHKDQQFEYINTTRYNSSQFILNSIDELFRDTYKKQAPLDTDTFENKVICNLVHLSNLRTLSSFTKQFSDKCKITSDTVGFKQVRITFQTNSSLYYLLNLVNLFALFNITQNTNEFLYLEELAIDKYSSVLDIIDAPYFIRYFFKTTLFRNFKMFKKFKTRLETTTRYPITMHYGDTHQMRMRAIREHLGFSNHVVDIGCGEGRYVWKIASELKDLTYYAIEPDEKSRDIIVRGCQRKNIHNVVVLASIDVFLKEEKKLGSYDFICTEVIEHMSKEEGIKLLQHCLEYPEVNTLIITTPNIEFNPHYFDEGLRHPDHVFEFKKTEFKEWLEGFWPEDKFTLETFDVGDVVDSIPTTLGAVFRRKNV